MINGKKILVIVPARGGSKGVPLKNIKPVNGVPLVALVGDLLKNIPMIDRAIASTDHDEIAEVAIKSGLEVPFRRPESLSGDRISDLDVLSEALLTSENYYNEEYQIIVMLQPTSPLRKEKHVIEAIEMLVNEKLDSVWSVSETDSKNHPFKQLTIKDGNLDYYDESGGNIIVRQQLDQLYHRNGAVYAMTRECLLEQKTIKGKNAGAYVIHEPMISIDTIWDFKLIDFILNSNNEEL